MILKPGRWPQNLLASLRIRPFSNSAVKFTYVEEVKKNYTNIRSQYLKSFKLENEYKSAGLFDKLSIKKEILTNNVGTFATAVKFITQQSKKPVIIFNNRDLTITNDVNSLQQVYHLLYTSYIDHCSLNLNANYNADVIIDEIIKNVESSLTIEGPMLPVSKSDVLTSFQLFDSLANKKVELSELLFENQTIQKLFAAYLLGYNLFGATKVKNEEIENEKESAENITNQILKDTENEVSTQEESDVSPERTDLINKLALSNQLNTDVVDRWFYLFDTFLKASNLNPPMIGPLIPDEFIKSRAPAVLITNADLSTYFFEGLDLNSASADELENLAKPINEEPVSEGEKLFKKSENESEFNGFFNFQEKDPKNQKKKTDKKEDFKVLEFTFNFNDPVKLFQIGLVIGLAIYFFSGSDSSSNEITFQEFAGTFLSKNLVSKLDIVNQRTAYVKLNDQGESLHPNTSYYFNIGDLTTFERNLRETQAQMNITDSMRIPITYSSEGSMTRVLVNFVPTLLFLGAIYYMSKKANVGGMGGPLGFGKSNAKKFNQETDIKIKFKDVAGMAEAKEEVTEFVKFLQNPEKYEKLGAKIPRGAILSGPPGTGKTLIAKATAGEAGVPFYSVSGSEFVEMFVGIGASRVRDLFKTARENAPSIVFLDEIDAIGKQRSKGNASGANDERETTLNQLLVEMDGFESSDHVVVLAGTNRSDILDKALMRPGRFDRHIHIDNPELSGRKEIFEVHLKKITLAKDIDSDLSGRLAALTPGFSGADIANVCNEAALIGARFNAEAVTLRHFELAIERVIGGVEKKSKVLNKEEQKIVAYHEAGHAVCGWFLKHASPLLKVSIIPRGKGTLGYAQYLPPDRFLYSALQLNDRMIMTLGGRVSEELHFSSVTGGAHDDFQKVTSIAQLMVTRFGMSDKIGMVNYADTKDEDNLTKPFSDKTSKLIDEEVQRIVGECYEACRTLLTEKAKEVKLVAEELIAKEFITREDMIRLLGKRPWAENNDAFDKYLDGKDAFKNVKPESEHKDPEVKE